MSTSPRTSTTTTVVASDISKHSSKRFSTMAPSIAESATSNASNSTIATNGDSRIRDIKALGNGIDRLASKQLQQQRYLPSTQKTDDMSKLALSAKLERALGRRMTGQDAVMRPKSVAVLGGKIG